MNCPNCKTSLTTLPAGDISLDACTTGCGGVWFEARELDKFDEPHEFATHEVLQLAKRCEPVKVDGSRPKSCPKCAGQVLVRQFIDPQNEIVIDQCWSCGGIWLDVGEINRIRSQYASMAERAAAVNAYVEGAIHQATREMAHNTTSQMARYDESTRNRFQAAIRAFEELIGTKSKLPG